MLRTQRRKRRTEKREKEEGGDSRSLDVEIMHFHEGNEREAEVGSLDIAGREVMVTMQGHVEIPRRLASGGSRERRFREMRFIQLDFMKHPPHERFSRVGFSTVVTRSFWI